MLTTYTLCIRSLELSHFTKLKLCPWNKQGLISPPSSPRLWQPLFYFLSLSLSFFKILFIYLFMRDRERGYEQGEGQKEKDKILKKTPPLCAEPHLDLDSTTLRSCPEPKSRVGHLTNCSTQTPLIFYI